jgi:hypothetical protein
LIGAAGSVSASGVWLDLYGCRVGNPWTATITASTVTDFATIAGGTIPDGAVGVSLTFSASVNVDTVGALTGGTAMASGNKATFRTIAAGDWVIGRVA